MAHDVFISYARDTSRDHAEALHNALGGRTAFLDTKDIEPGERFPEALVDALFAAKVVVIFAEPRYFTRWYCLLEFRIARTPFLRVAERPGATAQEKVDALRGLVIALPPRGENPMIDRFPPLVQGRNWPDVHDIEAIAALVLKELDADPPTLRERYDAVASADEARAFLLNEAVHLPPPRKIGNIPHVPLTGLPPSIRDEFVGRADDLWRIHDLLWTERGDSATAAALTGAIEATGGFGKTRLALEYLYRFGPRDFRGGLFWIDAERDPELQLYEVLQALNPSVAAIEIIRQGIGGVAGAVARAIGELPDDAPPPLFIIDNVPEPEKDQRPKPLSTWCPVLGEVPVLTTSRTQVGLGAGGVVALPIETLAPEPAVELLTTKTRRNALADEEWKEIAAWVGHLPLALQVLNRLLQSRAMSAREVLELSRDQTPSKAVDDAMESIRPVVEPGTLRGVTEAFSASYNLLSPEEQYAARLMAWMAPAPIPNFVIEAFGPEVFPPSVRAKLRGRSFVTDVRDSSSGDYYGSMHRVLADFVRAQSPAPEKELKSVTYFLTTLMKSVEGRGAPGAAVVRECAPLASSIFDNWVGAPSTTADFSRALAFVDRAADTLFSFGQPVLAGKLLETAATAAVRSLGHEHSATLSTLANLAIIWAELGDFDKARALQEQVLDGLRRTNGDEHPSTTAVMSNLAVTRGRMGDLAGAQELQEAVLKNRWSSLGSEHSLTRTAMKNLAITLSKRGELVKGQELLEAALALDRDAFGDEHLDTLDTMHNLANNRHNRGDLVGAEALMVHVFRLYQKQLGPEHPRTTAAAWGLLLIYADGKDPESANRVLQDELAWLLNRDVSTLTHQQRNIRAALAEMSRKPDGLA